MGCYPGVDESGRSPGALYDAAAEGLREAETPEQKALAEQAMKDAFNPAMSNPKARRCNQWRGIGARDFSACVHGEGPPKKMITTIPCQQNLSDGRVLVDGRFLVAGTRIDILSFRPTRAENGWRSEPAKLGLQK